MRLKYVINLIVFLLVFVSTGTGQKMLQENTIVEVVFPGEVVPGGVYNINISINGALAEGPGRLSVVLPEGFILQKDYESVGDVSTHSNFVNIVWGVLPKDKVFDDSFRISILKPALGVLDIDWRFTFLSYGEFETLKFTDQINVVAKSSAKKSSVARKTQPSNNVSARTSRSTSSKYNKKPVNYSRRTTSARSGEIEYFVQISSSTSSTKAAELIEDYDLQYPMEIIQAGNIYKYNVGPFSTYRDALEYCKELNATYDLGCFVVKYKGNQRIK